MSLQDEWVNTHKIHMPIFHDQLQSPRTFIALHHRHPDLSPPLDRLSHARLGLLDRSSQRARRVLEVGHALGIAIIVHTHDKHVRKG